MRDAPSTMTLTVPPHAVVGGIALEPRAPKPRPCSMRILVVDDNFDAADMLSLLLTLLGHDVRCAYSGEEALETIETFKPDCVLLDIGLPGISGWEVGSRLRASPDPRVAGCKLVAVSAWDDPADRQRSAEAGFDAHRTKPVDGVQLERLLCDLMTTEA